MALISGSKSSRMERRRSERVRRCTSIFAAFTAIGAQLRPTEAELVKTIDAEVRRTTAPLETLVNINRGTENPAGVREVARHMEAEVSFERAFGGIWYPYAQYRN